MIKLLHHLFIPHEKNNHRAKILHIDSLLIIISLIFFGFSFLTAFHSNYPSVLGVSFNITPTDLLSDTNKERQERGLQRLRLDTQLSEAAKQKAKDMFTKNYWAHIAPDGVTPWSFIKGAGYEYLYAGENLARGFTGSSEVVDAWMASPTHRDNLLSPNYTDVGFAIATGNLTGSETILVVEELGTRFEEKNAGNSGYLSSSPAAVNIKEIVPQYQNSAPELNNTTSEVAALTQKPLIDKNDLTKKTIIAILIILISVLIIDAIIIERKKIIRSFSHNVDHIIYLLIILFTIIIIGKGIIL